MFKTISYKKANTCKEYSLEEYLDTVSYIEHGFSVKSRMPKLAKKTVLAFLFVLSGSYILFYKVLYPVAAMHLDSKESVAVISPVAEESLEFSDSIDPLSSSFEFNEISRIVSNTKINSVGQSVPQYFYISIPKLEIKDALVETNSEDLSPKKSLAHYKGSCLPGDGCDTFIYGHSTFSNVKNRYEKGDYTAIFARLRELEYGDEFTIRYADKEYRYIVNTKKIDSPKNINVLKNPFSQGDYKSSITLFTCDPPGTTKNRLMVVGVLVG